MDPGETLLEMGTQSQWKIRIKPISVTTLMGKQGWIQEKEWLGSCDINRKDGEDRRRNKTYAYKYLRINEKSKTKKKKEKWNKREFILRFSSVTWKVQRVKNHFDDFHEVLSQAIEEESHLLCVIQTRWGRIDWNVYYRITGTVWRTRQVLEHENQVETALRNGSFWKKKYWKVKSAVERWVFIQLTLY